MSSHPQAAPNRTRKKAEDVGVFALATAGAVYATLTMGPVGLGVGCILLSVAAGIVVAREDGVHDPAPESSPDPTLATDGGREEH
jgi:hypothetical protein